MKLIMLLMTCFLLASCKSPSTSIQETTDQIEQVSKAKLFDGFQLTPYPSALFKPGYTFYIDNSNNRQIASTGDSLDEKNCVPGRTPSLSARSSLDLELTFGWLLKVLDFDMRSASENGVSISAEQQKGCTVIFSGIGERAKYIRSGDKGDGGIII